MRKARKVLSFRQSFCVKNSKLWIYGQKIMFKNFPPIVGQIGTVLALR